MTANTTSQLPTVTLSSVEAHGWDFIKEHLAPTGRLAVMAGDNVEAVVVSVPEYLQLIQDAEIQSTATAPTDGSPPGQGPEHYP